ncbi:MAG: aminotransferase class V-fold PLP-dependent enzyme [Chloroflexota bacterium]|nr:aminotransferase class V-fold PLP-dependent enzyme [Chloroflexota bacterium]
MGVEVATGVRISADIHDAPPSDGDPGPEALRDLFLLDPDVVFLNHGSFRACPRPVFDVYQSWQRELEWQPVEFLQRLGAALLDEARTRLAAYVNAAPDDLVFVPNATIGLNVVARSLPLQPGDEILATDHEYGALDLTWAHVCRKTGARYVRHPIPVPLTGTPEELAEALWAAVTPRTRVLFLSHVTSPTALTFPVAEICHRAREAGILSIVDGAHVPGHLPLDLTAIGADAYSGNCHKWLCAPKGSAFLHVRPEHHAVVEAMTVSWGWGEEEATFVTRNQRQGTHDLAAFLAVPAAIDFQAEHGWDAVRARCHALASDARARLATLTGLEPLAPDDPTWFAQMVAAPLAVGDPVDLKRRLYDEHRVEVPITVWNGRPLLRVSCQGYNAPRDVDALIQALIELGVGHKDGPG